MTNKPPTGSEQVPPSTPQPPTDKSATGRSPAEVPRWQSRWGMAITLLWAFNLLLLAGVVFWIFTDGRSHLMLRYLEASVGFQPAETYDALDVVDWTTVADPLRKMTAVAAVALVSLIGIFFGLFIGLPRQRSMRAWLALTVLVAGWLTLGTAWREVHWWGQQVRLQNNLAAVEQLAQRVEESWPEHDGTLPGLGRFLAYPTTDPRALMLMTHAKVEGTRFSIAAVERSPDGTIRFELADTEPGAWLEHRAAGQPESFIGGVGTRYTLLRHAQLRKNWYLVRYRS